MVDNDRLLRIAITVPYFYDGEDKDISRLLNENLFDYVHVRKPNAEPEDISQLINHVEPALRYRLTLHDHTNLVMKLKVGGIHVNRRFPDVPDGWKGRLSTSCHSISECRDARGKGYDYITLSPIFPSISKPGYHADFSADKLKCLAATCPETPIVALGGITGTRIPEILGMGFSGYAMLSEAWHTKIDPIKFRLQFITHPNTVDDAICQTQQALAGGCRWIQLRWKDADMIRLTEAAKEIGQLCRSNDAIFIIDDHTEMIKECFADGVHLGKNDMPVDEARTLLGPACIIGATANTPEDILKAAEAGADYIGYGPFRFTATKKNLSPVLGLYGYNKAVNFCKEKGIYQPIVAIGGITTNDIPDIIGTGINGIAVSGSIINSVSPSDETKSILKAIDSSIKHL